MSRKSRSGTSLAISSSASSPLRASPAISISGCDSQQARQLGAREAFVVYDQGSHWSVGMRTVAATRPSRLASSRRGAACIKNPQAFADVVQAQAGRPVFLRCELPGVLHLEDQHALFQGGANEQFAAAGQRRDAMFNAVFDQHLQQHRRHGDGPRGGIDGEANAQPVLVTGGFEREVVGGGLQFGIERHGVAGVAVQVIPEDVGEARDEVLREWWVFDDQPADRIEGIEKEVRIDLRFQTAQFGLAQGELFLPVAASGSDRQVHDHPSHGDAGDGDRAWKRLWIASRKALCRPASSQLIPMTSAACTRPVIHAAKKRRKYCGASDPAPPVDVPAEPVSQHDAVEEVQGVADGHLGGPAHPLGSHPHAKAGIAGPA